MHICEEERSSRVAAGSKYSAVRRRETGVEDSIDEDLRLLAKMEKPSLFDSSNDDSNSRVCQILPSRSAQDGTVRNKNTQSLSADHSRVRLVLPSLSSPTKENNGMSSRLMDSEDRRDDNILDDASSPSRMVTLSAEGKNHFPRNFKSMVKAFAEHETFLRFCAALRHYIQYILTLVPPPNVSGTSQVRAGAAEEPEEMSALLEIVICLRNNATLSSYGRPRENTALLTPSVMTNVVEIETPPVQHDDAPAFRHDGPRLPNTIDASRRKLLTKAQPFPILPALTSSDTTTPRRSSHCSKPRTTPRRPLQQQQLNNVCTIADAAKSRLEAREAEERRQRQHEFPASLAPLVSWFGEFSSSIAQAIPLVLLYWKYQKEISRYYGDSTIELDDLIESHNRAKQNNGGRNLLARCEYHSPAFSTVLDAFETSSHHDENTSVDHTRVALLARVKEAQEAFLRCARNMIEGHKAHTPSPPSGIGIRTVTATSPISMAHATRATMMSQSPLLLLSSAAMHTPGARANTTPRGLRSLNRPSGVSAAKREESLAELNALLRESVESSPRSNRQHCSLTVSPTARNNAENFAEAVTEQCYDASLVMPTSTVECYASELFSPLSRGNHGNSTGVRDDDHSALRNLAEASSPGACSMTNSALLTATPFAAAAETNDSMIDESYSYEIVPPLQRCKPSADDTPLLSPAVPRESLSQFEAAPAALCTRIVATKSEQRAAAKRLMLEEKMASNYHDNDNKIKRPRRAARKAAPVTAASCTSQVSRQPPDRPRKYGDMHPANRPIFPDTLKAILLDPRARGIIDWDSDRRVIVLRQRVRFEKEIMPRFFMNSKGEPNIKSFQRQLCYYGFNRRQQESECIYAHKNCIIHSPEEMSSLLVRTVGTYKRPSKRKTSLPQKTTKATRKVSAHSKTHVYNDDDQLPSDDSDIESQEDNSTAIDSSGRTTSKRIKLVTVKQKEAGSARAYKAV